MEALISLLALLRAIGHLLAHTGNRHSSLLRAILALPKAHLLSLFIPENVLGLMPRVLQLQHQNIVISYIYVLDR